METVMQCSAYYRDREGRRAGERAEGHEKGIEMYRMGLVEGTKGWVCVRRVSSVPKNECEIIKP